MKEFILRDMQAKNLYVYIAHKLSLFYQNKVLDSNV